MALSIISEALARIEHKLDAILRHLNLPIHSMSFVGIPCPACMYPITYTVDIKHGVVVRKCNCSTGKVPSTIPLTATPGEKNVPSQKLIDQNGYGR